jgi:lysyl-tRNA synthetase class 1
MYGKDLIESAELSTRLCRLISGKGGHRGPVQSFYEMFLDEEGRKISKSVGRGLTVDSWLAAAPRESLLLFIFKDPRKAKKLSWDVVLRSADEYLQMLQRRDDPAGGSPPEELRFIHAGLPPVPRWAYPVSYSMLIGLVAAIGMPSADVVKGYLHRVKGAVPESDPLLERLAGQAITYAREQILPGRAPRTPTPREAALLQSLAAFLDEEREAEQVQTQAFDLARGAGMEPKEFFRLLYNVLTGQDFGPRFGPFVKLLGQQMVARRLREAAGTRVT